MKTQAAALFEVPGRWRVVEMELDEPRDNEVRVRWDYSGLCHSDEHSATGDMPVIQMPFVGGHEGAGVVESVGSKVTYVKPGDHVTAKFVPSCGRCASCTSGNMNLCDLGMFALMGCLEDQTYRLHHDGTDVGQMCMLGTFSNYGVVSENSVCKIPEDVPLDVAALVSCGVATGWGSAARGANVKYGDTVIVMGCGGVGINAVQGAAALGASYVIACDPQELKRETALKLGATQAFADIEEAADFARLVTNGQGANAVIECIGVLKPEHVGQALAAVAKLGTVVVTGIGDSAEIGAPVNLWELAMMQKRIQGVIFGMGNPEHEIVRLLNMYKAGKLKLDELITNRYKLDQINEAYTDMYEGRNVRGVIEHQH